MQTSLETLGQLERRLTMSVPVATIESEISQRLARLARDAKVPGFRPGKVPLRMIAQQYGPKVRSDVISDAVQAKFADALREQNLRIAGFPRIEPKTDAAQSGELQFSAVFEVYPEVRIGDLADLTVERPLAEVGDEDITNTIEMLRRQRTHYHHVERAATRGDRVVVDFSGRIDGVEFPGGPLRPTGGFLLLSEPRFGYTAKFGERSCESGGIGRRTGFRFQRVKPCGFKSRSSHSKS